MKAFWAEEYQRKGTRVRMNMAHAGYCDSPGNGFEKQGWTGRPDHMIE